MGFLMNKWVIITLIIIVLIVVIVVAEKKVAANLKARKYSKEEDVSINKALSDAVKAGNGPTITSANAATMADKVFSALDGYGNGFDSIKEVYNSMKNNADYLLISSTFGTKTTSSGRFNVFESDFTGTMAQTVTHWLSSEDQSTLSNILKNKGINYTI